MQVDQAKLNEFLGQFVGEFGGALNVALVVGGSIVIPHLRRTYELLAELYG